MAAPKPKLVLKRTTYEGVTLVLGSAGSGKTNILQRIREAPSMGVLLSPEPADSDPQDADQVADEVDSSRSGLVRIIEREDELERSHQVLVTYRCEDRDRGHQREAEANVLFQEIRGGLAQHREVRRCKAFARAALVVFDVTSMSSYLNAQDLTRLLREGESDCVITLIGNKNYSQQSTRAIATLSAQEFAEDHKALYFEVNALGGQGVLESVQETLRLSVEPLLFSGTPLNKLHLVATSLLPSMQT